MVPPTTINKNLEKLNFSIGGMKPALN